MLWSRFIYYARHHGDALLIAGAMAGLVAIGLIVWAVDRRRVVRAYELFQATGRFTMPDLGAPPTRGTIKPKSQFELLTLLALVQLFPNEVFATIRPNYLRYPPTGNNLEIDWASEKLRLGVEADGDQHFNQSDHFHKSPTDFHNQQRRDAWKEQQMRARKWTYIRIPWRDDWTVGTIAQFIAIKVKLSGRPDLIANMRV